MSASSSEEDNEFENTNISRLGKCEVCAANEAKYSCPKCEVKTCGLKCVVIHKKELECDGIRDRTKFVRKKDFTDTDLLSDYRLLEECARFVYSVKRDEKKKFSRIDRDLPYHLFKLRTAAIKRGTMLQFLTQNFSRNSRNTTKYDFKANTISWRVEWLFPNAEPNPVKFVDEKCHEKVRLSDLLDKYLNPDAEPFEGSKALMFYKAAGFNGVKVLLKAEKVKGSSKKYFELDTSESLMENLSGKCVVEFPIIVVVLKDHAYNFNIVTPEDEFFTTEQKESTNQVITVDEPVKNETTQSGQINQANVSYPNTGINNQNTGTNNQNTGIHNQNTGINNQNTGINNQNTGTNNRYPKRTYRERQKRLLTEKVANDKQKVIENEIKAAKKRKPKNLLFTTGYSSEESVEISDDDSEVKLGENKT